MTSVRIKLVLAVVSACALIAVGTVAGARQGNRFDGHLTGYEEVPALSTTGAGEFRAHLDQNNQSISWELTFGGTESNVTQAHIHFENATENGPIVVFFCSNLGNGPAGTQACPPFGTISGTIEADDVLGNAADRGLEAGAFQELVNAMRSGATYVNVHTSGRPGGEIRAQLVD